MNFDADNIAVVLEEIDKLLTNGYLRVERSVAPDGKTPCCALFADDSPCPIGARLLEITDEKLLAKLRAINGQYIYKPQYGPRTNFDGLPVYWYENLPIYDHLKEMEDVPGYPKKPNFATPTPRGATALEELRSHSAKLKQ